MSEIKKYFRVKHSDCYLPFSMSDLDEFTNDDIKRIMGFTGDEEIEEISFGEYDIGSRWLRLSKKDYNWDDLHFTCGLGDPKHRIRHRTTDECKANRVARWRKKNKNKKTHRR